MEVLTLANGRTIDNYDEKLKVAYSSLTFTDDDFFTFWHKMINKDKDDSLSVGTSIELAWATARCTKLEETEDGWNFKLPDKDDVARLLQSSDYEFKREINIVPMHKLVEAKVTTIDIDKGYKDIFNNVPFNASQALMKFLIDIIKNFNDEQ